MFSFQTCSHPGCSTYVTSPYTTCFHHASKEEQATILARISGRLQDENALVRDETVVGGTFFQLKAHHKQIKGCNFAFSCFIDCDFSSSLFYNTFFDYCVFLNCRFQQMSIRYSVFAGAKCQQCDFTNSVILHSNFMGISARESNFSQSDLYYSNFSMSKLVDTSFEDANLKRVNFKACALRNVSFRYSNPEEAFFHTQEVKK